MLIPPAEFRRSACASENHAGHGASAAQGNGLRAIVWRIANCDGSCSTTRRAGGEGHIDRACSPGGDRSAAGIRRRKVCAVRSPKRDSGNVQHRRAAIGQCHRLNWRRGPHQLISEYQRRTVESYTRHSTRTIQREALWSIVGVIGNSDGSRPDARCARSKGDIDGARSAGASDAAQVLVSEKSPLFVPASVIPARSNTAVPLLVNVTACAVDGAPTNCVPKLSELLVRLTPGIPPTPLKTML